MIVVILLKRSSKSLNLIFTKVDIKLLQTKDGFHVYLGDLEIRKLYSYANWFFETSFQLDFLHKFAMTVGC